MLIKRVANYILLLWSWSPVLSLTNKRKFLECTLQSAKEDFVISLINIRWGENVEQLICFNLIDKFSLYKHRCLNEVIIQYEDDKKIKSSYYIHLIFSKQNDIQYEIEAMNDNLKRIEVVIGNSFNKMNAYSIMLIMFITVILTSNPIYDLFKSNTNNCIVGVIFFIGYILFNMCILCFQFNSVQAFCHEQYESLLTWRNKYRAFAVYKKSELNYESYRHRWYITHVELMDEMMKIFMILLFVWVLGTILCKFGVL